MSDINMSTIMRAALESAGIKQLDSKLRREHLHTDFLMCVRKVSRLRDIFVTKPNFHSARAREKMLSSYVDFAQSYNAGALGANNWQVLGEEYHFPDDFEGLATELGFQGKDLESAWNFLHYLLEKGEITGIHVGARAPTSIRDLAQMTLSLVDRIFAEQGEASQAVIIAEMKQLRRALGGNLKRIDKSSSHSQAKTLGISIRKQLDGLDDDVDLSPAISSIVKITGELSKDLLIL